MKKNLTELVFILDRSGSMQGLEGDTSSAKFCFIKNPPKLCCLVYKHSIGEF